MQKLILLLFLFFGLQLKGQDYAIIEFFGEKTDHSITYLGKVKKGDANRLANYLQYARDGEEDKEDASNYAPKPDANPKPRRKMKQLSESYKVDEEKLQRKKKKELEKYQKAKAEYYLEPEKRNGKKKERDFKPRDLSQSLKSDKTKLGKQYKVRGKKLRKGKKLKYKQGGVTMILKYKVISDGKYQTYVTTLNSSVKAGEKYYLKYYGNDGRRKYFLEKIPNSN